jgi:lipoprotein-releasing system ATP-binding protein
MGVSGSGKSTLFRVMGGLQKPDHGSVRMGGKDLQSLSEKALAALRNQDLGFVFQDHRLLAQCTALENVLLPALASGDVASKTDYAKALLTEVGLGDRLRYFPAQLSVGQCQRVAVARALVQQPRLILADEPTGALDRENSEGFVKLLERLRREYSLSIVTFTHSEKVAEAADRRFNLEQGSLREA